MQSADDLKTVLRMSKAAQGIPLTTPPEPMRTLTAADVEAVAERVVQEIKSDLLKEMGKLLWDGIRKLVITGALAMFAFDQVKGWLK